MLSLAKNTNNISLTNPLAFNLSTFTNLIQKVSISNIERIFNTSLLLLDIGITRIKSWLLKTWSPKLTKETLILHHRKTQNYTLPFYLAQLAKNNITISFIPPIITFPLSLPEHTHLIYNILPTTPNNLTINSLRNNKILFIEQITTANNNSFLPWNNIYLRTNKTTRGRQPSWFTQLIQTLQLNSIHVIWPHIKLLSRNSFINTTDLISSSNSLPYQLLFNNRDKVILQSNKSQQTTLYKINQSSEMSIGQSNLLEITNLPRNLKYINILYRQIKFNRLLLQIDYKEILAIIDIFNNLDLPLLPPF